MFCILLISLVTFVNAAAVNVTLHTNSTTTRGPTCWSYEENTCIENSCSDIPWNSGSFWYDGNFATSAYASTQGGVNNLIDFSGCGGSSYIAGSVLYDAGIRFPTLDGNNTIELTYKYEIEGSIQSVTTGYRRDHAGRD